MTDDIVKRLGEIAVNDDGDCQTLQDAKAEIERLRKPDDRWAMTTSKAKSLERQFVLAKEENERLQAEAEVLREALRTIANPFRKRLSCDIAREAPDVATKEKG